MEDDSLIQQLKEQIPADSGSTNVPTPQKKKFSLKEYAFLDLRRVILLAVVPLVFIGLLGVGGFFLAQQAENKPASLPPDTQSLDNLPSITLPSSRENVKGALVINVPTLYQSGLQVHGSASISGTLTAPNVLYTVTTGAGLASTGGQNPTVTNTGVLSLAGQTGALNLTAGDGIEINGLTISSPDQNVFKTIKVDSTSFDAGSATDTLTFKAGTGVSLSTDATGKSITITNSATGEATFWKQTGTTTHLKDITGNVGIGTTNATALLDVAGALKVSGLFTLGSDAFSSVTGNGLTIAGNTLQVSLLASSDGTGSTSSNSGLEFAGSDTNELALLQGCSDSQTLKWDAINSVWMCANDLGGGGGGVVNVGEGVTTYNTIDTIRFSANDFDVSKSTSTANVSLDYTNSGITRKAENETISGNWTFSSATPLTFNSTTPKLAIGDTGTLTITDGTNTLFTLTDSGTTGSLSVDALTVSGLGAGLVKTDANGTLSLASAGTDYESPLTFSTGLSRSTNTISVSGSVPTSVSSDTNVTGSIASHVLTLGWTGQLAISRGGTNSTTPPTAGAIAYGTGTAYAFSTAGNPGQVLVSGGGNAPGWQDASSVGINYWQRPANTGIVAPLTISDDLLLGSTATTSALIKLTGTAGKDSFINTGNFGIGITNPSVKLDVVGGIAATSGLTISGGTVSLPAGQIDNSELAASSLTITAGSGLSGGGLVSLGSSISISNNGVTSLTGTTDQVNVTANVGAITISLPQSINTTSTPTFAGMTLSGALTIQAQNSLKLADSDSSNTIALKAPAAVSSDLTFTLPNSYGTPNYVLTTNGTGGLSWQPVTGVGAGSGTITSVGDVSSGDAFTATGTQGTSLYFYDAEGRGQLTIADLTAARTYTLPNESGTVCLTSGNCSGTGAGIGGSGTTNYIAKFSGTYGLTDSSIIDNGNVGIGITNPVHKLSVVGTTNLNGAITTTGSISGLTGISSSGDTNLAALAAGGIVKADATTGKLSIALAGTDYQTPITGGTYESPLTFTSGLSRSGNTVSNDGVLTLNSAKGALILANATEASGTITIANAAADGTTKGIATFNSTNFSASTGIINTTQNINSTATPTFANLNIGTVALNTTGSDNLTSGATLIGVFGEFSHSTATTVQGVLADLDAAVGDATHDAVTLAGSPTYLSLSGQEITLHQIDLTADVINALPVTNGGTGINTYTKGDLLYSNADDSLAALGIGTNGQVLTVDPDTGIPKWSSVGGTLNFWQESFGALAPYNVTDDLLIGGAATSSALVRIPGLTNQNAYFNLGTGNVGIGLTDPVHKLSVDGTTNITGATTLESTLGVSGDLSINTNKFTVTAANGNTSIVGTLGVTGLGTFSNGVNVGGETITDFTGTGLQLNLSSLEVKLGDNIALNSSEVTGILASGNGGTGFDTYTKGDLIYASDTNTLSKLGVGTEGEVLSVGANSTLSWTSSSSINFWQRSFGALAPDQITNDFLLGGTATTSAKFAFLNMSGSGSPTASISGNLSLVTPTGSNPAATFNLLNGGSLNFQTSVGGDTGLTSRLFIANNGNVGIGTTGPNYPLDIVKNTNGGNILNIKNTDTGGSAFSSIILTQDDSNISGRLSLHNSGYTTNGLFKANMLSLHAQSGLTNGILIDTLANAPIVFATNGFADANERMRIAGDGNVGIGTSSPLAMLDVNGTASISGALTLYGTPTIGTTAMQALTLGSSTTGGINFASNGQTRMTMLSNGSLGIGTTNPDAKLVVAGNSDATHFVVRANGTQSNDHPLFQLQKSDGTPILSLTSDDSSNVFLGVGAGQNNTTASGMYNIFIGENAGTANTTGTQNVAIGYHALDTNTTGFSNIAIGVNALGSSTIGSANIAVGKSALQSTTTGSQSAVLGSSAGFFNTTGSFNAIFGTNAGVGVNGSTTYSRNSLFGDSAGFSLTSGSNNVLLGYHAGYSLTTGDNNILIGYNLDLPATTSNFLNIGDTIYGDLITDSVGIGNSTPGTVNGWSLSGTLLNVKTSGVSRLAIEGTQSDIFLTDSNASANQKTLLIRNEGGFTTFAPMLDAGSAIANALVIQHSDGSIGINTTTIGSKLQINGNAAIGYSASTAGPTNGLAVSGNVGIGITNPTAKLDVGGYGTAAVVSNPIALFGANSNDIAGVEMRNSSTGTSADTRFLLADTTGNYLAFSQAGVNYSGTMFGVNRNTTSLMFANGRDLGIGTFSNNSLIFGTNNAERFRITNTGNVGIGISNPGSKLQVNGSAAIGYSGSTVGPSNGLTVNGNIGIGIASPSNRLVIAGNVNAVQAVIKASSSQSPSNPLLQFQNSSGTPILALTSDDPSNVFLGVDAGKSNTLDTGLSKGVDNTFIGYSAGTSNTTGSFNTAVGRFSMYNNTTGTQNTAVGWDSLAFNTTGTNNSAFGLFSLYNNSSGTSNTALGNTAMYSNTTGTASAALGISAGGNNTTGSENTLIGAFAGIGSVGASYSRNSILGISAGYKLSTGSNNLLLGYHAGYSLTTGSNNIVIGYDIDAPATGNNYLSIGNTIYGDLSTGNIGIGDSTPTEAKLVVGSAGAGNIYFTPDTVASTANALCWDGSGASTLMDCTDTPVADYMEMYPTAIDTQMGDLVTTGSQNVTTRDGDPIKQLVKTTDAYQPAIGIISDKSKAGDFNSIGHNIYEADNPQPIALSGRVPVKVTTQNGQIHAGDFIATSTIPGVGMRATHPGYVVGQALADYTNSDPDAVGTVMVFVKSIWHDPNVQIASNGTVQLAQQNGTWLALDESGNVIDNKGVFSQATIAELKTGKIETNDIFATNLAVTAGIFDNLNASFVTSDSLTINDTLSAGRITTDELSFADFKVVQTDNKLEFRTGNASGSAVVAFTKSGDATFSGKLTAKAIKADNGDIDTLTVKNLIVENITGLTSSASAEMNLGQKIASEFADFDFAKINTDLTVLGTTTLNNAVIQDTLGIGTELTMTSNSINTVSQDLEIQPLKQAAVDFLAGAVRFERDGTVKFAENATFAKNVEVKGALTAKAVNVDQDTVIDLSATESTASASAGTTTIRAGQTTRKINTPFAKADSLIYVTPEGKTGNQVLYVSEKKDGYFTVDIENATTEDILFNFLIVNKSENEL